MNKKKSLLLLALFVVHFCGYAQITERPRPVEWDNLVEGARFIDRFSPMPAGKLERTSWGVEGVRLRYVDNGIENKDWSYWGGNIVQGNDNKYHLFVCGWRENSPKGHAEWPNSIVFHAISKSLIGPFVVNDTIGKGHNPEIFRLKDGRYVIYVIDGYYISDNLYGPWAYNKFEFNTRDRPIIEGLSNLTFAQREDGSYLMVCRGGGIWISQTGLSPYNQITDKRVYPDVAGEFEDPVVWRDHIQYHLIVNDWLGRIAFYLRSKDGVKWVVDPGEAYLPGISQHENGRIEDWFKYERIKIFQDKYGRAIQANFAVIDTLKPLDKANDEHSSKNISIPLNPGLLLSILNTKPITEQTKTIELKITAENGFNPHTDIDINSLRFGASTEVNYGRGCKAINSEKSGNDLIITFDAKGNGITDEEFAPKLIGKTTTGKLLFGYARLPWEQYLSPILSACAPQFSNDGKGVKVEIQNFGQVISKETTLKIEYFIDGNKKEIGKTKVSALKPYENCMVKLTTRAVFDQKIEYDILVTIDPDYKKPSIFSSKKVVLP